MSFLEIFFLENVLLAIVAPCLATPPKLANVLSIYHHRFDSSQADKWLPPEHLLCPPVKGRKNRQKFSF